MEGRAALWTLIGTLVAFKVVTILMIVLMYPSAHTIVFMVLMNWFWVPILAVFLAAPALVWLRLLRGRTRRAKLLHEEWHVEDDWAIDISRLLSDVRLQSPESRE